jgi:zinc transport system ATP-binding protein
MNVQAKPVSLRGPHIHFKEVSLRYGQSHILDDINLHVSPGQIFSVVGPNGGGKSSLLRCLLGQAPHTGEISLLWPNQPGTVGYVPQALEFDRSLPMTVMDFMRALSSKRPTFLPLKAQDKTRITNALEQVGLSQKANRRMGDLSGGERQRVLMAQSLIPSPDLLILDEPMAALDEAGVQVFQRLIQSLKEEGVTIVWVEHDLAAVRRLADSVVGICQQLLFRGDPRVELTPEKAMRMLTHPFFAANP